MYSCCSDREIITTPEIRDVLAKHDDLNVTILDKNIEMILAMTELMNHKNTNEVLVKGDWLEVDCFNGYFDVIISDLVLCNVNRGKQELFFRQIKKFLKESGHWVSRIYSFYNYTKFYTMDELLSIYSKKAEITREDVSNFLRRGCLSFWNSGTKHIEMQKFGKALDDYIKSEKFKSLGSKEQYLLEETYELFAPFNIEFYIDYEENTDKLLNEHFVINEKVLNNNAIELEEKGYFMYDLSPRK